MKKITIIDILIVLAVIVVALVGVKMLAPSGGAQTEKITYTVLVSNQLPQVADSIKPAEKVLLDTAENVYGSVIGVTSEPAKSTQFNAEDGKYIEQTNEERRDVYITVEADVTVNEWGYDIGSTHVRVGEQQTLGGPGYGVSGYIVDILD